MKALVAIALLGALLAGALLWPVGGRSFWQRASERGLPRATARLAARGVHSAWDLIFNRHAPAKATSSESESSRVAPPRRAPPRKAELARVAPVPAAQAKTAQPAPGAETLAGPDHIVAQPPKETLRTDDRASLEKLVRAAR